MTDHRLSASFHRTIADPIAQRGWRTGATLAADAPLDELARAASAGDVEAIGRLYDQLVGPIYRYIAVRVRRREDAEDLTHLVFERIVTALPRYRHDGKPFSAWAFRIARNAVIDHLRRTRRTEPLDVIAEREDTGGPERSACARRRSASCGRPSCV